ncbi:MAG: rfaE bifunctional protein kinase chain/domain, partial [Gammaproteobacteria bacterium]
PVPVLSWQSEEKRLGGAANVALNLKALGAKVCLCSIIGNDAAGKDFKKLLKKERLSTNGISVLPSRRTTVKTRMIASGQHLLRVDKEDRHELTKEEEKELIENSLNRTMESFHPDIILFQDYNKGLLTKRIIAFVLKWARQKKIPTIVDPKYRNFFAFQECTLFKPNLKEVNAILGEKVNSNLKSLSRADVLLREKLKNKLTMITLSEKGIFISNGKQKKIIPTIPRNIADVCGAGDTVVSIAALGLALGLPLNVIGMLSNLAGGQVCEKPGVVAVDKNQLLGEFVKVGEELY